MPTSLTPRRSDCSCALSPAPSILPPAFDSPPPPYSGPSFPPPPPTPKVDLHALPDRLDKRLLKEILTPCLPILHGSHDVSPAVWSAELVAWYLSIHPRTWEVLYEDNAADWSWARETVAQGEEEIARRGPLPAEERRLYLEWYKLVSERIRVRYEKLLALSRVRWRWLDSRPIFTAPIPASGCTLSEQPPKEGTAWLLPLPAPPGASFLPHFVVPYCPAYP
ncbi:hypothetical protein JCM10213_005336 [Rhodosporidiobolus nylandii]